MLSTNDFCDPRPRSLGPPAAFLAVSMGWIGIVIAGDVQGCMLSFLSATNSMVRGLRSTSLAAFDAVDAFETKVALSCGRDAAVSKTGSPGSGPEGVRGRECSRRASCTCRLRHGAGGRGERRGARPGSR